MIPQFWRVLVVNNSGQAVDSGAAAGGAINLKTTGWFVDPATGLIDYTPLVDQDLGLIDPRTIADGTGIMDNAAVLKTTEITNGANKFTGLSVQLEVTHDEGTAADGSFDLFLDGGDAAGELASDADGFSGEAEDHRLQYIGSLIWESNGLDDQIMRSPVFNIGG